MNAAAVRYGDLTQLDPSTLPKVDLLIAGVSCQPWSRVGLRLGFKDTRVDTLFCTFLIAAVMQPKAIFLENVDAFVEAAGGKVWLFVKQLARVVGFQPQVQQACASEWRVPQVRKRAFMTFVRSDLAKLIGVPRCPRKLKDGTANPGLGRVPLDDILLPFSQVRHLILPDCENRVRWVRNPDLIKAPLSETEKLLPVVAGLMDGCKLISSRVFINFIPAVKASAAGLGGCAHLIAQRIPGTKKFVARQMHVLEVIAMQEAPEWGIALHHSVHPAVAVSGIGNSCPARLFMPYLKALIVHFRPVSTFRPKTLA